MRLQVFSLLALSFLVACSGSEDSKNVPSAGEGGAGASSGGSGGSAQSGQGGTAGTTTTGGSSSAGDGGAGAEAGAPSGGRPSNVECELLWESGFENGFPGGEWQDYDNGSWSESGDMPDGRVSAWTIVDETSGEPIHSGTHAYRGWIVGAAADSHRPYPGVSRGVEGFETPLINTFWVYQQLDYDALSEGDWVHFGTWGNCVQDGGACASGSYALHTMSVRNRLLEFAHTDPFAGTYIGPEPPEQFPLDRWVKFTVYLQYEGSTGTVVVWQDGVPMLQAEVAGLAADPGTALSYMHWGEYAAGTVNNGTQYNDDIKIWSLPEALLDFATEPRCE